MEVPSTHPSKWSLDDVCAWLGSKGLESIIPVFRENLITGEALLDLSKEDLIEIGVKQLGARKVILLFIKEVPEAVEKLEVQKEQGDDGEAPMDDPRCRVLLETTTNEQGEVKKDQHVTIKVNNLPFFGEEETPGKVLFIICADRSGSMNGRPWEQVQEATSKIVEDALGVNSEGSIVPEIILYNSKADRLKKLDPATFAHNIRQIRACSRTNFTAAFEVIETTITENIEHQTFDEIVVVFMSDGNDTSFLDPNRARLKLEDFLGGLSVPTTVHTVGFSAHHHFAFLNSLRKAGSREGAFRYAEIADGGDALQAKFVEIFESIETSAGKRVHVVAQLAGFTGVEADKDTWSQEITLNEKGEGSVSLWVESKEESKAPTAARVTLVADDGGRQQMGFFVPMQSCVVEGADAVLWDVSGKVGVCSFFAQLRMMHRHVDVLTGSLVDAVTAAATSRGAKEVSKDPAVAKAFQQLEAMQEELKKVKVFGTKGINKNVRATLMELRGEIQTKLDALHRVMAEVRRGTANATAVIARASDIRYAGTFKKARRQRVMDQRVARNAAAAAELDDKLRKVQDELEEEVVEDAPEEASDFYQCTLSLLGVADVLLDEDDVSDIMGFGLAIRRPEHAVDDPTSIGIVNVSTTMVTKSAIEDAISHKIDIDGHFAAHGGFGEMGVTMMDQSRDPVNAMLPLYISPQHWNRVKLMLPSTLGWFCCLDPLAFAWNQLDVMLMVLGTMVMRLQDKASKGERHMRLLFSFQRTCHAMIQDFKVVDRWENTIREFVASPKGRTKDVVPNLLVLVGALLSLPSKRSVKLLQEQGRGQLEKGRTQLWRAVLLEHARRELAKTGPLRDPSESCIDGLVNALVGQLESADTMDPSIVNAVYRECHVERTTASLESWEGIEFDPGDDGEGKEKAIDERSIPDQHECHARGVWAHMKLGTDMSKKDVQNAQRILEGTPEGMMDAVERNAAVATAIAGGDAVAVMAATTPAAIEAADKYKPFACTRAMVEITCRLDAQVAHRYPSLTGFTRAMAYLDAWLAIQEKESNDYDAMDKEWGIAPEHWHAQVLKFVEESESTCASPTLGDALLCALPKVPKAMDAAGLARERAALVQCLRHRSNAKAREAIEAGRFVDLAVEGDGPEQILRSSFMELEGRHLASQTAALKMQRVTAVNLAMARTTSMWEFVGLLLAMHASRDVGFQMLSQLFQDETMEIPKRAEKLAVMLTGRFNDKHVLERGNVWMPTKGQQKAIRARMKPETFKRLVSLVQASTGKHKYRTSDTPNRHGHSKSNPYIPPHLRDPPVDPKDVRACTRDRCWCRNPE